MRSSVAHRVRLIILFWWGGGGGGGGGGGVWRQKNVGCRSEHKQQHYHPSSAEASFIQSTRMQSYLKII